MTLNPSLKLRVAEQGLSIIGSLRVYHLALGVHHGHDREVVAERQSDAPKVADAQLALCRRS